MVKILVVDDEKDIVDSVKMLIETLDYEVKVAHNGEEAIEIIKKEPFDLVVLDVLMPGISGVKTLQMIRNDLKLTDLKVIFLTVVGINQAGRKTVNELKPLAYLEKPINNTTFKEKIKEIIESS